MGALMRGDRRGDAASAAATVAASPPERVGVGPPSDSALSSMDSSFCEKVGLARISGSRLEWLLGRCDMENRGERRTGLRHTHLNPSV
jgi:hypothetical protein